jgi:hypothetical protein
MPRFRTAAMRRGIGRKAHRLAATLTARLRHRQQQRQLLVHTPRPLHRIGRVVSAQAPPTFELGGEHGDGVPHVGSREEARRLAPQVVRHRDGIEGRKRLATPADEVGAVPNQEPAQ